jgi:hypothetical protein
VSIQIAACPAGWRGLQKRMRKPSEMGSDFPRQPLTTPPNNGTKGMRDAVCGRQMQPRLTTAEILQLRGSMLEHCES